MSSAVSQGAFRPLVAAPHPGTQVLLRWAKWQAQHRCMRAIRIGVFRKDDARLVVYQYSYSLCSVLKLADTKPKIRDFREWRQPFNKVKGKLVQRGWVLVREDEEVSHVAH